MTVQDIDCGGGGNSTGGGSGLFFPTLAWKEETTTAGTGSPAVMIMTSEQSRSQSRGSIYSNGSSSGTDFRKCCD